MRYPSIIGNWKLNGSKYMVSYLTTKLRNELKKITDCTIIIVPPIPYLDLTKYYLIDSNILLGAQNVDINLTGAFTGEISAEMLKDIGVQYVIIGHSERRIYHKEKDEYIAKKFSILKDTELIPILCIGETEEERKNGLTEEVCAGQLDIILNTLGVKSFKDTFIAYEPIWAIGTGKSINPIKIQKIHKFIRDYISSYDQKISNDIVIQYGGSVNANNIADLFNQPDIDGVLVGSASLIAKDFIDIVNNALISIRKNKNVVQ